MRIFISWSGILSHEYAKVLAAWLPSVLQSVKCFISSDIESGSRWSAEVARELSITSFGILCLTEDSKDAPWVIFEAGALSKLVDASHVVPMLFDLAKSYIEYPLAQFQMREFKHEEMHKLVRDTNASSAQPVDAVLLDRSFELWWPQLEKDVANAWDMHHETKLDLEPTPNYPPILGDILSSVRDANRMLSTLTSPSKKFTLSHEETADAIIKGSLAARYLAVAARHLTELIDVMETQGEEAITAASEPIIDLITALSMVEINDPIWKGFSIILRDLGVKWTLMTNHAKETVLRRAQLDLLEPPDRPKQDA